MPILHDIPNEPITVAKGQDVVLRKRIRAEGTIKVTADVAAGQTTVSIDRDHPAFADGDMFILGDDVVVECNATCAAGAITMTTTSTAAPLYRGDVLQLLADLTGATESMEVLTNAEDATPIITLTGVVATQSAQATRGVVDFTCAAADTASDDLGTYYYACWRTGTGVNRPQVEGTFEIVARGRL